LFHAPRGKAYNCSHEAEKFPSVEGWQAKPDGVVLSALNGNLFPGALPNAKKLNDDAASAEETG